ncbi:sensor histidine kinase [Pseudoalteromonas aurantia]|uniref:histidine kinase n=1 Tax=Pseudoalteromonas aurantia TaxID=43654 RepID=A0A5S3V7T7_9GAMM|nr:PAS domain-containing sensor histidine kinase [Pseudoalteromonas aurantia]TMO67920.1 histidine kinase [Pseudoalteromonas aurantia]
MNKKKQSGIAEFNISAYDQAEFNDLLFENMPDYAFVKDENFKIVKANSAFLSMHPVDIRNKVIGFNTLEDYKPDEAELFLAMDKIAFEQGYSETVETITFPDLRIRTLLTRKKRFETIDGRTYILGIATDVTEREELIEQLRKSNDDLDQFAYMASHDLKAPLTAISKLVSWIDEDYRDELPAGAIENFELIKCRINRMTLLLNDMLTYSRVNQTPHEKEEFSFKELVLEQFDIICINKEFNLSCCELIVSLQKDAIAIVLRNLLANAIKHHHLEHGNIDVTIEEQKGFYSIKVTDDGPGIDPQYSSKIFEMFQTLKPRDQQEGSGIGLAICKKIANHYAGDITLVDQPNGTSFLVTWPSVPTHSLHSKGLNNET